MERKQIIALVVLLVLLVGVPFVLSYRDKMAYWDDFDSSKALPLSPQVEQSSEKVRYDLKVTSPRAGDTYFLSRPNNIYFSWEYPTHFSGRSFEQQVALISVENPKEVISIDSPMLQRYATVNYSTSDGFWASLPSEIPPGSYWVRVFLSDTKNSNGYTAFSDPIVVRE